MSYSYQFNKPGIYYYWSGYVDSDQSISFRGVVEVKETVDDKEYQIDVRTNNIKGNKWEKYI